MTTAKLNIQHDYITLTVKFNPQSDIRLTISRRGEKATAKGLEPGQFQAAFREFHLYMSNDSRGNAASMGDKMNAVLTAAQASANAAAFIEAMKGL